MSTELLRKLIAAGAKRTIAPRADRERAPLALTQQKLWVLNKLDPAGTAYNEAFALELCGALDAAALRSALDALVARHDVLRTALREIDGRPMQAVVPPFAVDLPFVDARGAAPGEAAARVADVARALESQPFALERAPLFRVSAVMLGGDRTVLVFCFHHLIIDTWSVPILERELSALYLAAKDAAVVALRPLAVQYGDFAAWQRARFERGELDRQLAYWRAELSGDLPVLDLPADRARPSSPAYAGAALEFALGEDLTAAIKRLCAAHGATLFMVLLAGIVAWFHKTTGQDDFVIGCPIANRRVTDVESLIGFFANTLPLRFGVSAASTFEELVAAVREKSIDAFDNQDVPFDVLIDELRLPREPGRSPVFQTLFNLDNALQAVRGAAAPEAFLQPFALPKTSSKFDLTFNMVEVPGNIVGSIQYSTELFEPESARRMVTTFRALLRELVASSRVPLRRVPLLRRSERAATLALANGPRVERDGPLRLHEAFERQVRATPSARACRFENAELTYDALNRRANRLADHLRRCGVGRDAVVGVEAERSIDLLPTLLGVLKAGAAYLPLDPEHPDALLSGMVCDAQAVAVVGSESFVTRIGAPGARGITLDEVRSVTGLRESDHDAGAMPDDLAYVLFTSGSTGKPKASMIAHRGIVNRLAWMQEAYRLLPGDVVLQKTAASFDVSLWELFWPLLTGASLVLARPDGQKDPEYLWRLIAEERISALHFVPSMLRAFLELAAPETASALRLVVCSGETLPKETAELVARLLPHVMLVNLYGPTEASVDVTAWTFVAGYRRPTLPIGEPIANVRVLVLDDAMECVPVGVAGELYIGGVALARGYRAAPGLTAERFVPDPFVPGERLYRTGDRGRQLDDGTIEFLGRVDAQVKLRGFRIELGHLEAALLEDPAVAAAAAMLRTDGGDPALVGYVVPARAADAADDARAYAGGVLERLAQRVPAYMVPASLVVLDALPRTSSGKIHRKALPPPHEDAQRPFVAPRTATEETLATIWRDVLRLERAGIEDNFFAIGGDSIRGITVVSRARAAGVMLDVPMIFKHQTIAELAAAADERDAAGEADGTSSLATEAEPIPGASLAGLEPEALAALLAAHPGAEAVLPLAPGPWDSYAQFRAFGKHNTSIVQSITTIPAVVDLGTLQQAFDALVAANPVLRCTYRWDDLPKPVMIVNERGSVPMIVEDWRHLTAPEQRTRARVMLEEDAARGPGGVREPSPWRAFAARINDAQYAFLQTFNYFCLDGWSMLTVSGELWTIYAQIAKGQAPAPVERPPYQRYLSWVNAQQFAEPERYWREELAGYEPALLSKALAEPSAVALVDASYQSRGFAIPGSLSEGIRTYVRTIRGTESLFYLTAWAVTVAHFVRRSDIVLGVVITGRAPEVPEIQKMVGFTMNYQPLRLRLDRDERVLDLFERIKQKNIAQMDYDTTSLQQIRRWCGYADDEFIFDSLFYFQNIGGYFADGFSQTINGRRPLAYARTAYPLRLDVFPTTADVGNQIFAGFLDGVLTERAAERVLRAYAEATAALYARPQSTVGELLAALERADGTPPAWTVALDPDRYGREIW